MLHANVPAPPLLKEMDFAALAKEDGDESPSDADLDEDEFKNLLEESQAQ
jgi:hypothetical protein